MESWNFKVHGNPKEIRGKLESALGPAHGFVFDIKHETNNSVSFKVRKRILYVWYMAYHNWTVVKGKLVKTAAENNTDVAINFRQHFLMTLIIFTHFFLGLGFLIMIFSGVSSNASFYILGGVLLAIGMVLWVVIQKKLKRDIQEYKALITEVLEP